MCGRYLLDIPASSLAAMYAAEDQVGTLSPRFNIAPGDAIPVIDTRTGGRVLEQLVWGVARPGATGLVINARVETVTERRMFAGAVERRRVIVPASGFYEWQRVEAKEQPAAPEPTEADDQQLLFSMPSDNQQQPKRSPVKRTVRTPWCFAPAASDHFSIAGIVVEAPDLDGQACPHVVLLTTAPNDTVAPVHHRMPLLLSSEQVDAWLDAKRPAQQAVGAVSGPVAVPMRAWQVGTQVNDARNDSADLIRPAV